MPSYGLIVEGTADEQAFSHLIRKTNSPDAPIYALQCGGVDRLMKEFPILLKRFEYAHNGGPVDGALVIRDCDDKMAAEVVQKMREKLGNRTYRFRCGVELCVIQKKLDSWLLADEASINKVSLARRGRAVGRVNEIIEEIPRPKEKLRQILSEARLNYTAPVLAEIAASINLETLAERAPSFHAFRLSVLRIQEGANR